MSLSLLCLTCSSNIQRRLEAPWRRNFVKAILEGQDIQQRTLSRPKQGTKLAALGAQRESTFFACCRDLKQRSRLVVRKRVRSRSQALCSRSVASEWKALTPSMHSCLQCRGSSLKSSRQSLRTKTKTFSNVSCFCIEAKVECSLRGGIVLLTITIWANPSWRTNTAKRWAKPSKTFGQSTSFGAWHQPLFVWSCTRTCIKQSYIGVEQNGSFHRVAPI